MNRGVHKSVLLKEVLEYLKPQQGEIFLDGTINGGGHSEAICSILRVTGVLVGIDEDEDALRAAEERLAPCKAEKHFFKGNFRSLDTILDSYGIEKADKILFDLGLSSRQIEISGRGFSFQKDEPLLMTFSSTPCDSLFTAEQIVNEWKEENIAVILENYGEERHAKRIAKAITTARGKKRIATSRELAEIIENALPTRYQNGRIHPATKTFQAIRMTVNDEVQALYGGLEKSWNRLASNGRIAVISFHSVEDRIVKNFFRERERSAECEILTKKSITPSREEMIENPRSRSAKLRAARKN